MKALALGLMPMEASPQSHLAAGPWCFCGQESNFPDWEHQFTFAPEPLADPGRLPAAARAAQRLCVELIPVVASMLTSKPEMLPPQYWQVLLTPWLIDLASQIVERSLRCQAMLEAWGKCELQIEVLPLDCEFAFTDERDFTLRGDLGVAYNHWLFSRLLEYMWPEAWQRIDLAPYKANQKPKLDLKERGRNFIRRLALSLPFPRLKGMSITQALQLSKALDHACLSPDRALNFQQAFAFQEDLARIPLPSDLSPIIEKSLPASLKRLRHRTPRKTDRSPKLRIASIVSHEDAEYRQALAYWRARGNRIGNCQHGGNYGMVAVPCAAEIEEYSQEVFFTWGWTQHGCAKGNFEPLPSLQLSAELASWQGGATLIFTGAEMAAYPYRLDSRPTPLQFVEYRQAKADFFTALDRKILAQTLYRPYFNLPGTLGDTSWLLPQFPGLKICKGALLPQIQRCRLLVLDHHGTTLLEALAAGIPVLCYWRRESWPLTSEGNLLLDMLADAGIWLPGPVEAAQKANEVWANPKSWLETAPVQMARRIFAKQQALSAPNALQQWQLALKKL